MMLGDQLVAHEVLVFVVGRCMGLLCADNCVLGSQDTEWLQGAMNVLIVLFIWWGLVVNVAKSKAMTCQPGTLRSGVSEEFVGRRCGWEVGSPPRNVEYNLPRDWWLRTCGGCMGQNQRLNGTGFRLVRQNTSNRCLASVSWRARHSANYPL